MHFGPAAPAVAGAVRPHSCSVLFQLSSKTSTLAGNTSAQKWSYTVSYGIVLRYDMPQVGTSGATVPIKVELVDWNGVNLSSSNITCRPVVAVVNFDNWAIVRSEVARRRQPDVHVRGYAEARIPVHPEDDRIPGR